MSDDLKQAWAKAFSKLPPGFQDYINNALEQARTENAKQAPNPLAVLVGYWLILVEQLFKLRAGQILTVLFMIACMSLIFYGLFDTDQGRDLLQLAQDQRSVTTLFIGMSAIASFGTSLALKAILTDRPIDDFIGWGAMPSFGIGAFGGFFDHSFWTFVLASLLGGSGFVLFLVLEISIKRNATLTAWCCGGISVAILLLIALYPGFLGHQFGSALILILSVFAWVLLFYAFAAIGFLSGNPGNGFRMVLKWGGGLWIVKCLLVALFVAAYNYPILDYVRFDREKKVTALPTLNQALDGWKANQERKVGTKPKLVLVAAAGGGIRASYWTSLVLARLLDLAPEFRKSLFASSGVSGGSLGLGVFYGLLAHPKLDCRGADQKAENCVNVFHENDFLAGPLGAIVAGYAANNIFFPIFPSRDDALEQSWERAWRTTVGTPTGSSDMFSSPMGEMWGSESSHPLLLLNATLGSTGERAISADLDVITNHVLDWKAACKLNLVTLIPLQLSAAIGASARFPFVSEWGWIKPSERDHCEPFEAVADGGFFDNYGATTILDLLDGLLAADSEIFKNYEVVVIQITNDTSREMGCVFSVLDRDKPAREDYCAPVQRKTEPSAWHSFTQVFTKMNPILQLTSPGFPQTMERLPAGLWAAFFGSSGPSVVDVTMQARTATGIGVAEKLRDRVCSLGGSYYHLSATGAGEIPLGWTLSKSAQTRLSSLLDEQYPKQRFERLVGKLKGGDQTSQCVAN